MRYRELDACYQAVESIYRLSVMKSEANDSV